MKTANKERQVMTSQIEAFLIHVKENKELQQSLGELSLDGTAAKKIVEIATAAGFTIKENEFETECQRLNEKLSESDLENITGGSNGTVPNNCINDLNYFNKK
ncbi:MAG: Nif11-like leader peptide family RiPP precursor [Pseudodesulfovibrio sp.]|nr:Nif11-like leader peptide family RiPP precursor [Pseudodesulfovibrio sp.]